MNLYEKIKERREELGMTQDELAGLLGYTSRSTIAKIEKGINDIPQAKITAFANALQLTPAELMGWDSPAAPASQKLSKRDKIDISIAMNDMLTKLDNYTEALMFDGEPLDEESRELLKASIENSLKIGKLTAKQKYTPKKYKKNR